MPNETYQVYYNLKLTIQYGTQVSPRPWWSVAFIFFTVSQILANGAHISVFLLFSVLRMPYQDIQGRIVIFTSLANIEDIIFHSLLLNSPVYCIVVLKYQTLRSAYKSHRVSANDPFKKLAKVKQHIAWSSMAT